MRLRREDWLGNDIVFETAAEMATGITISKNLGAESFVGCVVTIAGEGDSATYINVVKVVGAAATVTLTLSDNTTMTYTRATGVLKTAE